MLSLNQRKCHKKVKKYKNLVVENSKELNMKYRTFTQNKLWRDKVVDLMEDMGSKIHWKKLEDAEFTLELKVKFMEEAHEVCEAQTRKELVEECADIIEVIMALGQVHGFTLSDILDAQKEKKEKRGGFSGRRFVTVAQHQTDSFGEKYCLADPQKYPEIVSE